jgi:hypothetical protein
MWRAALRGRVHHTSGRMRPNCWDLIRSGKEIVPARILIGSARNQIQHLRAEDLVLKIWRLLTKWTLFFAQPES